MSDSGASSRHVPNEAIATIGQENRKPHDDSSKVRTLFGTPLYAVQRSIGTLLIYQRNETKYISILNGTDEITQSTNYTAMTRSPTSSRQAPNPSNRRPLWNEACPSTVTAE